MSVENSQLIPGLFRKAVVLSLAVLFSGVVPALAAPLREGECDNGPRDVNPGPGSLRQIRPLEPTGLNEYVRDREAAIVLGKALFWDMQVGSDGVQACATCHFRAGADPRSKNQAHPGGANNSRVVIDLGNNTQLNSSHFPLHKLSDPTDRGSTVLHSFDDVISSQGVKLNQFVSAERGASTDNGFVLPDPVFNISGKNVRRTEPRNTPTVVNAAFNRRNFWDGRADHIFNGVNPFGVRDPNARVFKAQRFNNVVPVKVRIDNGSLASQAVAPPLSDQEMSFRDRPFRDIGKRLLLAKALKNQLVHPQDSVLGPYAERNKPGLKQTYAELVAKAFQPQWWFSNRIVVVDSNGEPRIAPIPRRKLADNEYLLAEYNFALFFGLAVQLFEMTLISDDAPIDRFFEGDPTAISDFAKEGIAVFQENACAGCHSGAEFTNASTRILLGANGEPGEIIERMPNGNCNIGVYDQSFYNIGVRPSNEDLGIGANDPFGNPLSIARLLTMPADQVPSQELLSISYPNILDPPPQINERLITTGSFKVPSLRNIELTAPYFHNGGQQTLRQVVEFYNRGGDFRETNADFVDLEIGKLNLTDHEIDAVVEFLKTLTDPRLLAQQAPFDHPQLFVPNGHSQQVAADGTAQDIMIEIPAVGRNGGPSPNGFLE